ncbi:MAG: hypothetical protein R2755_07560 [Acidimicrobiales bacterium]
MSPWRADCTAVPGRKDGTWLWGDNERKAYVEMHNAMSDVIATVMDRIGGLYWRRIGWVAPGLTHRSFLSPPAPVRPRGWPPSGGWGPAHCRSSA